MDNQKFIMDNLYWKTDNEKFIMKTAEKWMIKNVQWKIDIG